MFSQFAGKQCTWQVSCTNQHRRRCFSLNKCRDFSQFWLWHNKKDLREWSSAVLIGRVSPIPPNPYPEPRRWVKTS